MINSFKKLLLFLMLVTTSVVGYAENVCEWNGNRFVSLAEAFKAGADEVYLLTDLISTSKLEIPTGTTIYTNGFSYTGNINVNSGGCLDITKGSTVTGQIVIKGCLNLRKGCISYETVSTSAGTIIAESSSTINIYDGEIRGANYSANIKSGANVNMYGGKLICTNAKSFPGIMNRDLIKNKSLGSTLKEYRYTYKAKVNAEEDKTVDYFRPFNNVAAVDNNETEYSSLVDAIENGESPITLKEDYTVAPTLNIHFNKEININGYTVTSKIFIDNGATLNIHDGDRIEGQVVVNDHGSLIMDGGEVVDPTPSNASNKNGAIIANSGSTVQITGGTVFGQGYSVNIKASSSTTITGGEFVTYNSKSQTGFAGKDNATIGGPGNFYVHEGTSGMKVSGRFTRGLAEDENGVKYLTFAEIQAATSSEIHLIEDYASTSKIELTAKKLYLNGHTLNANVLVNTGAELHLSEGDNLNGSVQVKGTLEMNGGSIVSATTTALYAETASTVTITDGLVQGLYYSINVKSGSTTNVSGGNFVAVESKGFPGIAGKANGTFEKAGKTLISYRDPNGTDHSQFLEGMIRDNNNNFFSTMSDAMSSGVAPLTLLCDYNANYQVVSKDLILNGHTFNVTSVKIDGATLTVGDGDFINGKIAVVNGGGLTMTGGTITQVEDDAEKRTGTIIVDAGTTVNISGGYINGTGYSMNVKSKGTTTISGGIITTSYSKSNNGFVLHSGDSYITELPEAGKKSYITSVQESDESWTRIYQFVSMRALGDETGYMTLQEAINNASTSVKALINSNEAISVPMAKTLTLDLNGKSLNGTLANEGTLTITDSSVGKTGLVKGAITSVKENLTIIGGTYPTNPNEFATIPSGYYVLNNGDGTWTVNNILYVASDENDTKYETLQDAIDASSASVKMLSDCEESVNVANTKDITFNLNGFTITGNITNDGTLCILDTSNGRIDGTVTNSGTLTLKGGTYNADQKTSLSTCVLSGYEIHDNADGTWTVSKTEESVSYDTTTGAVVFAKVGGNKQTLTSEQVMNVIDIITGGTSSATSSPVRSIDLRNVILSGTTCAAIRTAAISHGASSNVLIITEAQSDYNGAEVNIVRKNNPTSARRLDSYELVEDDGYYCANLILQDFISGSPSDFNTSIDFTANNASYSRTITNTSMWGTIVLPYQIVSTATCKYYQASWGERGDGEEKEGFIRAIPLGVVSPNTPVLFKRTSEGTNISFNAENVEVKRTPSSDEIVLGGYKLNMVGVYSYLKIYKELPSSPEDGAVEQEENTVGLLSDIFYISANQDKFMQATKSVLFKPFRAYLLMQDHEQEEPTPARSCSFFCNDWLDSSTSPIIEVDSDTEDSPVEFFNIDGTRSTASRKGLQIVRFLNGKSTIIIK